MTILVVGSACQPWLTTPDLRGKTGAWKISLYKEVSVFFWILTFHCFFNRVTHKSSKVLRCDGGVRLRHQAVGPLSRALCDDTCTHLRVSIWRAYTGGSRHSSVCWQSLSISGKHSGTERSHKCVSKYYFRSHFSCLTAVVLLRSESSCFIKSERFHQSLLNVEMQSLCF